MAALQHLEELLTTLQQKPHKKYVNTYLFGPLGKQEGYHATNTLLTDNNREISGGRYYVRQTIREEFIQEIREKIEKYKKRKNNNS